MHDDGRQYNLTQDVVKKLIQMSDFQSMIHPDGCTTSHDILNRCVDKVYDHFKQGLRVHLIRNDSIFTLEPINTDEGDDDDS